VSSCHIDDNKNYSCITLTGGLGWSELSKPTQQASYTPSSYTPSSPSVSLPIPTSPQTQKQPEIQYDLFQNTQQAPQKQAEYDPFSMSFDGPPATQALPPPAPVVASENPFDMF
jgi:hypothetical protein